MSTKPISKETLIDTVWQNFKTTSAMIHGIKVFMVMMLITFLTPFLTLT